MAAECLMLRDASYGALCLIPHKFSLEMLEHNFSDEDMLFVTDLLESRGSFAAGKWEFKLPAKLVLARVESASLEAGYSRDVYADRALRRLDESVARNLDLPVSMRADTLHESADESLRRHLRGFYDAMQSMGDFRLLEYRIVRRTRKDSLGLGLPFARVRGVLVSPVVESSSVADAIVRSVAEGCLVRRHVFEAPGGYGVEIGFAPTPEMCEGLHDIAPDVRGFRGMRAARFRLVRSLLGDDRAVVERELARAGIVLAVPNPKTVVARIPSGVAESTADDVFQRGLSWADNKLDSWGPILDHIGGFEAVQ